MSVSTSQFQQYFLENAISGFVSQFPSLKVLTTVCSPAGSTQGSTCRVPYVSTATGSATFAYATGYASDTTYVTAKTVTMDSIKYERWLLTDADYANLNPTVISEIGKSLGAKLSATVAADVFSVATGFASSSYNASQFTSSVAGVSLLNSTSTWGTGKALVMNPTLKSYILRDSNIINNSIFGGGVASQGKFVIPYYSFDAYDAQTICAGGAGLACKPSALLFANSYHTPQTNSGLQYAASISDPATGITLGYRVVPVADKATTMHVIDCLYGKAVGDSAAGLVIPNL